MTKRQTDSTQPQPGRPRKKSPPQLVTSAASHVSVIGKPSTIYVSCRLPYLLNNQLLLPGHKNIVILVISQNRLELFHRQWTNVISRHWTYTRANMGWIRIGTHGAGLAQQLHNVAAKVQVDTKTADEQVCEAGGETNIEHDRLYPILSRRAKDQDLPFIPASEVVMRNGKNENRLCTHLITARTDFRGSVHRILMY